MEDVERERASEEYLNMMKHKQITPSGERIQYSNYGMGMLGVLLEDVTGLTYREYLHQNILHPLRMDNTHVETPADLSVDSMAVEHVLTSDGSIQPLDFYYKAPAFLGSGGLFFSADDMATFMSAVLNKSEDLLAKKIWDDVLSVQESANPYTGVGYGFWMYERERTDTHAHQAEATIIGHSGGTQTFKSKMLLFPKENVGIFVALVGAPSRTFAGRPGLTPHTVTDRFIDAFRGNKEYPERDTTVNFLNQFEGNYYSTRRAWAGEEAFRDALIYESLSVTVRDSSLYMDGFGSLNFFGGSPRQLQWVSDRSFRLEGSGQIVSFSENGKYMNRGVYNNYDRVHLLQTPRGLLFVLSTLALVLLSSFVLLILNLRSSHLKFEIASVLTSLLAIGTIVFQMVMFGVFRVHFRLENSVFLAHGALGWLVLFLTLLMTYVLLQDLRKHRLVLQTPRAVHRVLILTALWLLNFIFIAYDVIRIA